MGRTKARLSKTVARRERRVSARVLVDAAMVEWFRCDVGDPEGRSAALTGPVLRLRGTALTVRPKFRQKTRATACSAVRPPAKAAAASSRPSWPPETLSLAENEAVDTCRRARARLGLLASDVVIGDAGSHRVAGPWIPHRRAPGWVLVSTARPQGRRQSGLSSSVASGRQTRGARAEPTLWAADDAPRSTSGTAWKVRGRARHEAEVEADSSSVSGVGGV